MKKGIFRVAAVFMTVFIIAGVFYGCGNKDDGNTVTDPQGHTYLAIEGSDGKTYAGVTGADGKLYAAKIDEKGNVEKDGDLYEVTGYTGTLPANDTTAVSVNESGDEYNYAGESVVTDKDVTTSKVASTKTTSGKTTSTTKPKETTLLAEKYKKLFASGTYYIEFSSEDIDSPVTAAIKGGNIYMQTKLEGMSCTMIYQQKKDNFYVVLNDYRVYCKMPSSMMDELDMANFATKSEVKDVTVYEATIGDRDCVCEAYELKDGGISTYYFYKDTLVRMDQIDKDGNTSVMNIIKISSSVSDSLFELPKGFIPFNLSKLDLDKFTDDSSSSSSKD